MQDCKFRTWGIPFQRQWRKQNESRVTGKKECDNDPIELHQVGTSKDKKHTTLKSKSMTVMVEKFEKTQWNTHKTNRKCNTSIFEVSHVCFCVHNELTFLLYCFGFRDEIGKKFRDIVDTPGLLLKSCGGEFVKFLVVEST